MRTLPTRKLYNRQPLAYAVYKLAYSHRAAVILPKGSVVAQGGLDGWVSSIPYYAAP